MPLCSRHALLYETRLAQLNEDKHKCRIVPQNGLLMPLIDDRHPLLVAGPCASAVNRLKPMEKFFGRETGKMEGIRRPRLQQGERIRGEITSSKDSKGQEGITLLHAARGKKQEARRRRCFRPVAPVRFETWRRAKEKTDSCRHSKRR